MDRNTIPSLRALLIVAIVASLHFAVSRNRTQNDHTTILFAREAVIVGELLHVPESYFCKKRILRSEAPPQAMRSYAELREKIVKRSIRKGDHVTPDDLYSLDEDIPDGHVAVGLAVEDRFLPCPAPYLCRQHVDVWLVKQPPGGRETRELLWRDVLLLAVDSCGGPTADVVTLALAPDAAKKLGAVKETGSIQLTLGGRWRYVPGAIFEEHQRRRQKP